MEQAITIINKAHYSLADDSEHLEPLHLKAKPQTEGDK